MIIYKAFDITDSVNARPELTQEQIENIEQVVRVILNNLPINKIYYQVPEQRVLDEMHPIIRYNEGAFNKTKNNEKNINFELDILAEKLLFEEQIEEKGGKRRRNKKIKEGLLFAKHTPEQLVLLKFEDTQIIDKNTFKPIDGLSVDKQYYKIVVIKKDIYKDITVVDRNKVIAKYWAEGFLELERERDSFVNTMDVLDSLENDELINSDIGFNEKEYKDVKQQVRNFFFESNSFDKDELFSTLNFDSKKFAVDSNNLFESTLFDKIDSDFEINKDVIAKRYKKTIRISKTMKVTVDNLFRELKRENIEVKNNRLSLNIAPEYIDSVKKLLELGKGNG
ncbi:hypothetical protein [Listeria seeligeri]|uniref:hypothetical protein n=1 Tax=Listeria seeligeri TaxID=1640 RepID=UPI0016288320|nr:hypothetical protein [Listeria seeligeri]MBC1723116.1 hypothetical protein [Listeria seeligeri]MBC2071117.1 hypothetical protein [Listeria seeligeri]MBC2088195.1 hypothetical protein [Listeria seeligeri]MBF2346244.1 hypothetical protein [Listeria seeligeri]MBF2355255.1 hypothetical protein [Listeria seeligeri]